MTMPRRVRIQQERHAFAADDQQWRTILRDGPGAANEASRLFNQLKPTLPLLLANLRTVGQILVTYRAGLEQILVLMPPFVANLLSAGPDHNPTDTMAAT